MSSVQSIARLSSKSQLTIPAWARRALALEPGHRVVVQVEDGRLVLTRVADELDALQGSCSGVYGEVDAYLDALREDRSP